MGERGTPARRAARFVFVVASVQLPRGISDEDDSACVWWRLVAANNRVLGRSARTFGSIADCRVGAAEMHDRVRQVVTSLATDVRGQWTWTASLDGELIAQSAHPYLRRIDCVRTLALFLAGVASADPRAADIRQFPQLVRGSNGSSGVTVHLPVVAP
ncbi:MAG TPA: hypothetical protein VJ831_15960 [Jatrophihabitantaceae bacterium]|nr:hypothetical protein [Jatrophihabitantaceae bacterium]